MNDQFPTPEENCYTILGVPRGASQDAVLLAFRRLSKAWHPDVNPDVDPTACNEAMVAIKAARDILADPAQRSWHDQLLDRATPKSDALVQEDRDRIAQHFSEWRKYSAGARHPVAAKAYREQTESQWKLARSMKTRRTADVDPNALHRLDLCEQSARDHKQAVTTFLTLKTSLLLTVVLLGAGVIRHPAMTPGNGVLFAAGMLLAALAAPSVITVLARLGFPRRWLIRRIACDPQHAPGILLLTRADAVFAVPAATSVVVSGFVLPFLRRLRITAPDGKIAARALLSSASARKVEAWAANARALVENNPRLAFWVSADNSVAAFGLDLIRPAQRPAHHRFLLATAASLLTVMTVLSVSGLLPAVTAQHPIPMIEARLHTDWIGVGNLAHRWSHPIRLADPGGTYRDTVAGLDGQVLHLLPADFSRRLGGHVEALALSR